MLDGNQKISACRPDDINHRSIKVIKDTVCGEKVVDEVGKNLTKGTIPKESQNSMVVMISKLRKDYVITKRWRPINLINCIGK